ncbi:MAG: carboxymuconolactone decarboxylase family protein, partial [bacterium]
FNRAELVEIVSWSAWQYGGPRMLSSWRAEDYKQNGKVVLEALPVRMAYDRYAGAAPGEPFSPPLPDEPAEAIIRRAKASDSPPADWLEFLSAHPRALRAWSEFYWRLFEGRVLPAKFKQLIRVRLSQVMDCPEWASEDSPRLKELGIGAAERAALRQNDRAQLSAREIEALSYAEVMSYGSPVDNETFSAVAPHFSDAEKVELGFIVAIQIGTIRVYRWLKRIGQLRAL